MIWTRYLLMGIGLTVLGIVADWGYSHRWGSLRMVILVAMASTALVLWSCVAIAAVCCGHGL